MSTASCTCKRYRITAPDGSVLEGELVRDPKCREHGFPDDRWPAGHPLRIHRRWVSRETNETFSRDEAHALYEARENKWFGFGNMFREETPRETEARLYRESLEATT
jgi:hypothetical protein